MRSKKRLIDLSGQRFGSLFVTEMYKKGNSGEVIWFCLCDCGRISQSRAFALKSGHTRSCGCSRMPSLLNSVITHGKTTNGQIAPEYISWQSMKDRCLNKKNPSYLNYGGRGITICHRWLSSFENFFEDMGVRPSSAHSLDRYPNNDGNYEPGNVRWATQKQQMGNVRYNVWYEYNGVIKTMTDWGRTLKCGNGPIYYHLNRGKSMDWVIEYFAVKKNISII